MIERDDHIPALPELLAELAIARGVAERVAAEATEVSSAEALA
jgi:uncharacterized protein (UPF0276 family)